MHRAGCELRRSPGLAGEFGPDCGPMRGLPATLPGFSSTLAGQLQVTLAGVKPRSHPCRVGQALRRSDLRSLDSALQSRVGDGFLVPVSRFRSRTEQVRPVEVARLPEHEVRDDCEGPRPAVDGNVPRFKGAAPGLTRKHLRRW